MSIVKSSQALASRPNFPPYRLGDFTLELENESIAQPGLYIVPLRPLSGSEPAAVWKLCCRTNSGTLAGGVAIVVPLRGDSASPRSLPHPVLGEWISALRYTGLNWMECGAVSVAPGFPEEGVMAALWEGLSRLMERNGVSFLIGTAPFASLALDMSLSRGARVLEPFASGNSRYFLFVK